jgi:hypothetical protein
LRDKALDARSLNRETEIRYALSEKRITLRLPFVVRRHTADLGKRCTLKQKPAHRCAGFENTTPPSMDQADFVSLSSDAVGAGP